MVSAWPEPPNAKSADVRCGVQGRFASGGIETPPNWAREISEPGHRTSRIGFIVGSISEDIEAKRWSRPTACLPIRLALTAGEAPDRRARRPQ
jgi:hypothetical protein